MFSNTKELWLTGPPNDDVNSSHLYNAMFYGIEDARHMTLNGWAERIENKYIRNRRRMRPFETGQSFGIGWIERYLVVNKVAAKMEREIKVRHWNQSLLSRLVHYFEYS